MLGAGFRTGTATHRTRHVLVGRMPDQMKLTNAGIIERTPGDKPIKIMCMQVDKNKINAGCRFPNRHSHTPDLVCAGYENAGSKKFNKCRYY